MSGPVISALENVPSWAGNVPAWFLVGAVIIAFIKVYPKLREQTIQERFAIKNGYAARIKSLEQDVKNEQTARKDDRDKCGKEMAVLRDVISDLEDKIIGMQRQAIQEQISLINAIISSVDTPELKALMRSLESVQVALRAPVIHSQHETVIRPETSDE
jgi:hypothetical protein